MTVSRNTPCPCGSGKKYKQCCGSLADAAQAAAVPAPAPADSEALLREGWRHQSEGRLQQAAELYQKVLGAEPNNSDALNLLGTLALQAGRNDMAANLLEKAIATRPEVAVYHNNLGNALRGLGRLDEAGENYRRALSLKPDYARAHNNLGVCLKELERMDEALACFRQAVALEPAFAEAWGNLGNALKSLGQLDEAVASLDQAVRLKPDFVEAWSNRGNALTQAGRLGEAIVSLERAIELRPDFGEAHSNMGSALRQMGRFDEALQHLDRAIELKPDFPGGHWNLALFLLELGKLERGWIEHEWRLREFPKLYRPFPCPRWAGEPLAGKSLLIWGEQGVGDEILFSSGIPDAIKAGARVVVECEPRLVALLARSFPGMEVHGRENPPHPRLLQADIDYQLPMGSLARWYRPTLESFPAHRGYLTPAPERIAHWKDWLASLGPGPKVGISWRSMKRGAYRDSYYTELSQWGEILRTAGIVFVNLQYGDCREELEDARRLLGGAIHEAPGLNLKDELDDAAALTKALDLVIAPNTSVFAMAGAVGVPTWLLNLDSDWTMLGTDRMPWFPDVKAYLKGPEAPWAGLLAQVARDLSDL